MTLTEYLLARMGDLNDYFGYDSDDLEIVVEDALALYGVDTEAEVGSAYKLRKLALPLLWQKCLIDLSQNFDVSIDGQSFKQSQFYTQVKELYDWALNDALIYNPDYFASVGKVFEYRPTSGSFTCWY